MCMKYKICVFETCFTFTVFSLSEKQIFVVPYCRHYQHLSGFLFYFDYCFAPMNSLSMLTLNLKI